MLFLYMCTYVCIKPLVRFFAESRHRSCLCSESPMRGQLASAFADLASQVSHSSRQSTYIDLCLTLTLLAFDPPLFPKICSMTHHAIANPAALKRVVSSNKHKTLSTLLERFSQQYLTPIFPGWQMGSSLFRI